MFYESFEDCIVTSRGDLRFAGYTGVWDGDVWLVATNTDGDSLWSQRFSEGPHEEAQGMAPANDGGIVVCGSSGPFPGADWFIAKTDTLGIPIWERMFAEGGDGICTEIRPLQQGGYLGIGSSGSTEIPDIPWEIKLIRVTEAGDSLWGLHLTIGHDCGARSGFQTPDGGFIVAGWSAATDTSSDDLLLVRFGRESLNAEPSGNGVARAFALHPIYPNPFNSTATISFVLPSPEHVDLRVFDVTGRHVASVADQMFNAGVHSITYDASGLTSGVYFCRLMAGGFSQTRKMLLVK